MMDVDAALYPRKAIERIGIAPLTSMYQHGENDRRMANDWRPEIHDSDGLSMLTGNGEWIWRPLMNPLGNCASTLTLTTTRAASACCSATATSITTRMTAYSTSAARVSGSNRKTLRYGWGAGAVQLVELPHRMKPSTTSSPSGIPPHNLNPDEELLFSYRLYWGSTMPVAPALAQVVATRTGIGGVVGQPRKYFSWRFAVDFTGGKLAALSKEAQVEPVISASRGEIEIASARPQAEINGYRAMFDLKPTDDSTEPIDLRLYLRQGGQPLTETWLYQWTPPPLVERKL